MLEHLKKAVCRANIELVRRGLVTGTFGNASAIDRERGLVVIKPSGLAHDRLTAARMVVVGLDGRTVEGGLRPSSDTPTHLALYRAFAAIGAIAHTHSTHAVMFAQARRGVPCLGTTHADVFRGEVPVTRPLTRSEVRENYEANTGKVIVERFDALDPMEMPAVLVAHHGPFTWGRSADDAVETSSLLEDVAHTAFGTLLLNPRARPIPRYLLDRHYLRKHGDAAYYGQKR